MSVRFQESLFDTDTFESTPAPRAALYSAPSVHARWKRTPHADRQTPRMQQRAITRVRSADVAHHTAPKREQDSLGSRNCRTRHRNSSIDVYGATRICF